MLMCTAILPQLFSWASNFSRYNFFSSRLRPRAWWLSRIWLPNYMYTYTCNLVVCPCKILGRNFLFYIYLDFTTSMGMLCSNVAGIDEMHLECWRSNSIMCCRLVVNLIKDVHMQRPCLVKDGSFFRSMSCRQNVIRSGTWHKVISFPSKVLISTFSTNRES